MSGMSGPLTDNEIAEVNTSTAEVHGRYILSHANAKLFVEGLGRWVLNAIDELESDDLQVVVVSVAKLFVESASRISEIVAERNSSNEGGNELPPVLPHQLVRLDMRRFVSYVNEHRKRLERRFSAVEINLIGDDLSQLQRAYREESAFKAAVDNSVRYMDFSRCWEVTTERFSDLRRFCGGLATAFPNTATVESDFSVIGWEKDEYRTSLTDFSLESILHCKQYKALNELERLL
jgi:hypothetical protein